MSFFLRLLGFMVLLPSLAHAATLEIPGDGTTVSGIGVISGWKCEVEGDITISLNGEAPFPAMYGLPRSDTSLVCGDDDGNNGFFSYWNWGNLGDGEHTVVVYDNDEEFAESTFTVTTPGTGFLRGASKEITVEDFPNPGDTTVLEWNEGTQHFEIVDFMGSGPYLILENVYGGIDSASGRNVHGLPARHRLYRFRERSRRCVYSNWH